MNPTRLDSLRCVVVVALDELRDLVDADPAAAYSNRAVRDTIACLERDWLDALRMASDEP